MCNCKKKPEVQNRQPEYIDPFDNTDEFFTTPTKEQFLNEELRKWNGGPQDFNNGEPVPYQSMKDNKDFNI